MTDFNRKEYDLEKRRLEEKINDVREDLNKRIDESTNNLSKEIIRSCDRSDEGLQKMKEDTSSNKRRLDLHDDRFLGLETWKSSTEVELRNLVKEISNLVKINTWMMTTTILTLLGFIMWYIQKLGGGLF